MIRDYIQQKLLAALDHARQTGELAFESVPSFTVETPPDKQFGDFSSNVALVLARQVRMHPRDLAMLLRERIGSDRLIDRVEVAGPGFLNFYLTPAWLYDVLLEIDRKGAEYGRWDIGQGRRVQVEYVSANPTGPIAVVQGRAAAFGDTLANLLETIGCNVFREYYVNDGGSQVEHLARSLEVRYLQLLGHDVQMPADGYPGEYLIDIARDLIEKEGDRYLQLPENERLALFNDIAVTRIIEKQKQSMDAFGVKFDCWFHEKDLYADGRLHEAIRLLQERGYTYEQEGALWFRSTDFGDDKDRVLVRSNGQPTYLASDIAYHLDKFRRGFEHVIDVWGPDHHGHVKPTMAGVAALGCEGRLEILLHQIVRLFSDGELVRMSKRAGDIIPLDDVIEQVGKDAARFFFLMRGAETPLDFDLDLAKRESSENPVYYVQYAHARICSILREGAKASGVEELQIPPASQVNLTLLASEQEFDLIRKLSEFPMEVRLAAEGREPHRLTLYSMNLASAFHIFYRDCRVLNDDQDLTNARLVLVKCTRTVLRNTLALLGVSAPERM
ncbi:MAG: arginine--tRNA ligase [Armatimonadota bacterium]